MKITAIEQQAKRANRYSVYVDEQYSFSLSESALLDSGIHSGLELTAQQAVSYKRLSSDDKAYGQALRYVVMRQRSTWQVQDYLAKKGYDTPLLQTILNKLTELGLLDDERYAAAYIHDKQMLCPTSRRKIIYELKKKRVPEDAIQKALAAIETDYEGGASSDDAALLSIIATKRRQHKYADNTKLMQYLARQGFDYGSIKAAIKAADANIDNN